MRFEEILAARRNIYGVGLESRCPGQGEKQPVDLAAIPVTALPEIFYVIYVFLLFPLLLLLSLLHLPGSIPELLYLRVDLLQLHFRRIIGRYDFRHCLLHRFAFPSKAFHPVVQLLPFFFPEFVRFFFRNTLAINEINAKFQLVLRRHVVFDLKRGNILRFQSDEASFIFRRCGAGRQPGRPAPAKRKIRIRFQTELAALGEEFLAQNPVRVVNVTLIQVIGVVILDDAAHLHVGQCEGFRQELHALRLHDGLVKSLSFEIHNRAIRPDCPGLNAVDVSFFLKKRNLHVGVLSAFLRQDLDPRVVVFVRRMVAVISVHLPVQIQRQRSRRFRHAGHLQLLLGDRLPFVPCTCRLRASHGGPHE